LYSGKLFVGFQQSIFMSKAKDPNRDARLEAEKDILKDPDLSDDDPTDDLDEAELAQKDNSDEEAFDELEKNRPAKSHPHSGKGNAK
jgi:hypothetical protein